MLRLFYFVLLILPTIVTATVATAAISAAAITATAATVAAATAAVTAAISAATAISAASTAVFARAGFVDDHAATVVFLTVKLRDGVVGVFVRSHLDEAETARTSRFSIHHYICRFDRSGSGKILL